MTYGSHLRRSRHGSLSFRYVFPADVRGALGKSEISIGLGTSSKRHARLPALELLIAAKGYVAAVREAVSVNDQEELKRHLALHLVVKNRQISVLTKDIAEGDVRNEALKAQNQGLQSRLMKELDSPRSMVANPHGPSLSMAIGAYQAENLSKAAWTEKTAAMWASRLRLLLEWFGDVPVSGLTREGMTGFFSALQNVPKNASKYTKLRGLGMRQLIETEGYVPIGSTTVNQIMECMTALFAWMDTHRATWKVSGNIAKDLLLVKAKAIERVPFNADDLRLLFSSLEWKERKFLHSYNYWLLPMGLFTGARINELCQIDLSDFSMVHGHPVVSICTEGLKAKNEGSRRSVPLHPELLRLGLMRHVDRLRRGGAKKLFPECIEKRDGHAQDASRWFGKFRVRAGITDPRKVFHSFRHGFITQLLNAGVNDGTGVAPLVGHKGTGAALSTYWNEKDMKGSHGNVCIVVAPVVAQLPLVEEVTFGVDVHRSARRPPIRKPRPRLRDAHV